MFETTETQDAKQTPILEICELSKSFAQNKVLDAIDLKLYPAQILSILGPNGAGKTTLINLLLGRLSPSSGNIHLFNAAPGALPVKQQCGAMLQIASLPDTVRVKEMLTLFRSYYPAPYTYQEVVELAGLSEFENALCKELSGGQKQRLLFALAICGKPKLLFLDEPSVGMDISSRKRLWQAILKLKELGTSIILTTHYLEEAEQLSDRIVMLSKGKIVKQGTPHSIKQQFKLKTIQFVSDIALNEIQAVQHIIDVQKNNNQFTIQTEDPVKVLKQIVLLCDDMQDLTVSGKALEDAFLQLEKNQRHHATLGEVHVD